MTLRAANSLDLTTLRLFLAVVEERSMTKAAEREHITVPAISKRVLELETRLNVRLLERSNTGVTPTAAGFGLAADARSILNALEATHARLNEHAGGVRGKVRISANPTSILGSLPKAIQTFAARYPLVEISLEEKSSALVVQAVSNGDTDIGIFFSDASYSDLEVVPYRSLSLFLAVPADHPLGKRRSVAFEETADCNFVLHPERSRLGSLVADAADANGFTIKCRARVATQEGMRRLVAHGLGVAVVPEPSMALYSKCDSIRCVRLSDPWARLQTSLCTRPEALSMSARLLLAQIKGTKDRTDPIRSKKGAKPDLVS